MKIKLVKYRGERTSHMVSFEERIKRKVYQVNDMLSMTANEELRLLGNKHRRDIKYMNDKFKRLEEIYVKNNQEMTENIDKIKKSNQELAND